MKFCEGSRQGITHEFPWVLLFIEVRKVSDMTSKMKEFKDDERRRGCPGAEMSNVVRDHDARTSGCLRSWSVWGKPSFLDGEDLDRIWMQLSQLFGSQKGWFVSQA